MQDIKSSKAAGVDKLSGKFLKDGANILAKPVSALCNLSVSRGVFPSACKFAKLKPIFKKGKKTDPSNYRPISLFPVVSKIIDDQTNAFLSDENILYSYQSGFRENYSTDLCLSYLTDKDFKGFYEGLLTGMILIYLQEAFDTIDHEILLHKLKVIRFSKGTLQWFRSYLSERIFLVNIESKLSDFGKISCGVPHGSVLGPLLFLIYENDMPQAVKSTILLYADDSCILYQHKEVDDKHFNKDFIHFGEDKTKSIPFASKRRSKNARQLNIRYNHINIKQHSQATHLGCVMDERMSCEPMSIKFINKINGKIKFLYRKFSHILIMCAQPGTLISTKKRKRKYK